MTDAAADDGRVEVTWWDRMAHTRLRDAVRGRWTPRVTIARLLSAAELPAPIRALIQQVVRSTRLWKREKLELTRELIAHFSDGLKSSESPDRLVRQFGDPAQAARLIRRAKKRNRPRWWRAWIRTWQLAGCLVLLCVGVYSWSAIRVYSGSPSPRHDYLADLNRDAASVPPEQRAWPIYRSALITMGTQPVIEGEMSRLPVDGDAGWAAWSAYLNEHEASLQIAREAASMPQLGYVATNGYHNEDLELFPSATVAANSDRPQLLIGVLLPQLAELRKLSMAMNFDALLSASQSDGGRAHADLIAMLGLAHHARECSTLISDLVSFAILAQMLHATGEIMHEWPQVFTDPQLQSLARRIAAFSGGGRLQARLEGERAFQRDFIQHAFTDDGNGNGRITDEGLRLFDQISLFNTATANDLGVSIASTGVLPVMALITADRRTVTQEYDRIMNMVERDISRPLWEIDGLDSDSEVMRYMMSPLLNARYFGIGLLLPALSKVVVITEQATQRRDAILVAIALEIYRRRHGSWPDSLDALVPELLPAVPPDRFDGAPLRYQLIDGEPVVYSIGTDRDDDGGRPPLRPDGTVATDDQVMRLRAHPPVDGDWILWPGF